MTVPVAVAASPLPSFRYSALVLDTVTFVLFVVFVAFLFLGYEGVDHAVPFSALSAAALFASLAVLFVANWRADPRPMKATEIPPN